MDECNSGGITDTTGKYLDSNKCYSYIGQKVSDVKKDATAHSKFLKWNQMPGVSTCQLGRCL